MKLKRGMDLADGRVIYWLQNFAISCVSSHDGRWHVGHFDREEFESIRENTIVLIKDEIFQFSVNLPKGLSVKALRVVMNGTFVFSVHRDPDAEMASVIVVASNHQEIFRLNTTCHLVDCALSEFGRYLALSFSSARDKKDPFGGRLEVFDLETGEVVASLVKGDDLRYADIVVTEPDGNVIAFHEGKGFKVC